MANTKTPGVGERQTLDLCKINPLIGQNDDTSPVQFVLGFLSFSMQEATGGALNLGPDDSLGLAFILDTCRAALANGNGGELSHD